LVPAHVQGLELVPGPAFGRAELGGVELGEDVGKIGVLGQILQNFFAAQISRLLDYFILVSSSMKLSG
jgi:hypothetical protein